MQMKHKDFKKVNYAEYEGKYDAAFSERLVTDPLSIDLESMRAYIYGYTFTEEYAQGIIPDEMHMDYWWAKHKEIRSLINEMSFDSRAAEAVLANIRLDQDNNAESKYEVGTIQEKLLLEAIDSTGDGRTPETALEFIHAGQRAEYLLRVKPFRQLLMVDMGEEDGCEYIGFAPNDYGIERLYYAVRRRFDVETVTMEQIRETEKQFEEIRKKYKQLDDTPPPVFNTVEEVCAYYNAEPLEEFDKKFRSGY